MRAPGGEPLRWKVSADVEALTWHPHQPTCFLVSSEDGIVTCYDARKGAGKRLLPIACPPHWSFHPATHTLTSSSCSCVSGSASVFQLSAHDAPTCSMSFSMAAPGLLATGSTDKKVKLWDVSNHQPSLIASQDLQVSQPGGGEGQWAGGGGNTASRWSGRPVADSICSPPYHSAETYAALPAPPQIGAVFSATFCGQAGYLLACGGAMGSVTVWDMRSLKGATQRWPSLRRMGLQPDAIPEDEEEA